MNSPHSDCVWVFRYIKTIWSKDICPLYIILTLFLSIFFISKVQWIGVNMLSLQKKLRLFSLNFSDVVVKMTTE